MEKKNQKFTWLLLLQGWAMMCVVIDHSRLPLHFDDAENTPFPYWLDDLAYSLGQTCFHFVASFHMPLFFMISGYLFYMTRIAKNWNFIPMIKEKWVRLGIPYFFFILIAIAIKLVYTDGRPLDTSFLGFIRNFTHPFDGALREMWFIAALFLYFILYPFYHWIMRYKAASILIAFLGCALFFIPASAVSDFLAVDKAVHFFVFFFLGICICRWKLERYINSPVGIFINLMIFPISTWYYIPLLKPLSACLFFWGLAVLIDEKLTSNIFHSFRDYTYQIFLIGIFGQIAVKVLYQRFAFPGSYFLWWLLCILIGLYLPVLISKYIERHGNFRLSLLNKCIGLKTGRSS